MFMTVAAIVFQFLMRLRFLQPKLVSQIIRIQYGDTTIKRIRKFEKTDYRLRKADFDLEFLVRYRDNNVILRFLNFSLAKNVSKIFSYLCSMSIKFTVRGI